MSQPVGPAAIRLRDVVKRYGGRAVLDGLSLEVRAGELLALLGPNGAGKTTAVEILEGYRVADAGTVEVLGEAPRHGGREIRARVGIMLQDGGLDPRSTPRSLLRLYAGLHEAPRDPEQLLDLVGLGSIAGRSIRRLSGGERQRCSLALALVGDPEVLLLDEPTAGMDPEARRATRALIAGLRDEGRAILLTTHDLGDVERLADRVAILGAGRLVAEGTVGELIAGAAGIRVRFAVPLTGADVASLRTAVGGGGLAAAGVTELWLEGLAPTPGRFAAIATWAAERDIQLLELRATSLEDRYLQLTGDRGADRQAVA